MGEIHMWVLDAAGIHVQFVPVNIIQPCEL